MIQLAVASMRGVRLDRSSPYAPRSMMERYEDQDHMNVTQSRKGAIALGGTARRPEDVEALIDLGLEFAEIAIENINNFKLNFNKYLAFLESSRFYFLCHGPKEGDPNDIASLREAYAPHVIDILQLMPALGMSLLTVHLWLDRRFINPDVLDFKVGLLGDIIEEAAEKRITVCLENLSEDCHDIAMAFNRLPLLYLTLDVGHAQLLREKNLSLDLLASFSDRIKHIHLHDNLGGNTPADDLHLPPGKGTVDFTALFEALKNAGYKGTATLELKPDEIRSCLEFIGTLSF
jgi:sugar phosphate isomerase/epimerase